MVRRAIVMAACTLLGCASGSGLARFAPDPSTGACPGSTASFADTVAIARDLESPGVVPPVRHQKVFPRIPQELFYSTERGSVLASFVVDSTGRLVPSSIVIMQASHPLYAASVCRTLPEMEFLPPRRAGRVVSARVSMPFQFQPVGVRGEP